LAPKENTESERIVLRQVLSTTEPAGLAGDLRGSWSWMPIVI
jgi:hypothetical protein